MGQNWGKSLPKQVLSYPGAPHHNGNLKSHPVLQALVEIEVKSLMRNHWDFILQGSKTGHIYKKS